MSLHLTGPAAYMLPMVMGPHTVGKVSQPSFSIKGRSKLGGISDDLHKARVTHRERSWFNPREMVCLGPFHKIQVIPVQASAQCSWFFTSGNWWITSQ